MPKEARKRGRRAEKKRKEEREADELRQNPIEQHVEAEAEEYYDDAAPQHTEEFHGLLTPEEAEYFRTVDEVLDSPTALPGPQERALFIANVFREAAGKELKLACSQGCSRLLEKLVRVATPAQVARLWRAVRGHLGGLVRHRFASHCCEALVVRSVAVVVQEEEEEEEEEEGGETMESLVLGAVDEIEPEIVSLLTHTFASHPVRALLLHLSGQPPPPPPQPAAHAHARKTTIPAANTEVPESFAAAADRIVAAAAARLDTEQVRAMAVHPVGGPTLQALLQVEMRRPPRGTTLLHMLAGGEGGFFASLLYDPVGSHLAERVMACAPAREFEALYAAHFRTRMGALARNETAGFVVGRVLERVRGEALREAVGEIVDAVPGMVERGQVAVIKTLIDVCAEQEVDIADISKAISSAYDCAPSQLIFQILSLTPAELLAPPAAAHKRNPKQRHGSHLAQCLLHQPCDLRAALSASLAGQTPATTVALSQHAQASHAVQALLLSPHTTPPERRKLLNGLRGSWAALAVHPAASHVVDAAWVATAAGGLANYRHAIAAELARAENHLRECFVGRAVWRNWEMDRYKARRSEWFGLAGAGTGAGAGKTAIELARERHAAASGTDGRAKGHPAGSGKRRRVG